VLPDARISTHDLERDTASLAHGYQHPGIRLGRSVGAIPKRSGSGYRQYGFVGSGLCEPPNVCGSRRELTLYLKEEWDPMNTIRKLGLVVATLILATAGVGGVPASASARALTWPTELALGTVRLQQTAPASGARMGPVAPTRRLTVDLGLSLRNRSGLLKVIWRETQMHHYLSRRELYHRFAPPAAQVHAVRMWLNSHGIQISRVSRDHLEIQATATSQQLSGLLSLRLYRYRSGSRTFFANSRSPLVPARLGINTIVGLDNANRPQMMHQFDAVTKAAVSGRGITNGGLRPATATAQISRPSATARRITRASRKDSEADLRIGGYFGSDLQSLYDVAGHGANGSGETLGFTLWGPGVSQGALTINAQQSGANPIVVDTENGAQTGDATTGGTCVGTISVGPDVGQSCVDFQESPSHVLYVLEGGDPNSTSDLHTGVTFETALDLESAHGIAPQAALKYYLGGETGDNAGMLEAITDAADDPTLHAVSDSWGEQVGIDTANDPFYQSTDQEFELAAAAGTTFYFSTGDQGMQDDYPASDQWVVAVGGTGLYSAPNASTYSTELDWSNGGGGSACSNVIPRPFWQTGISAADCSGRATPDISLDADPGTGFFDIAAFPDSSNIDSATYDSTTGATLTVPDASGPADLGSQVHVSGMVPTGYNGTYPVSASTTGSLTYMPPSDPGSINQPVTNATYSGAQGGLATVTFASLPAAPPVGSTVTIAGIAATGDGSFNGTYTVADAGLGFVSYVVGHTAPGTYQSGGTMSLAPYGGRATFDSDQGGQVGGTSLSSALAAAEEADLEQFIGEQTYSGATPAVGFTAPMIYTLGNGNQYVDYFHDVTCGNDAYEPGLPNGDQTGTGWDQATGFGSIDWYNFAVGYATQLGAENLTQPSSLNQPYPWTCAKYPGNLSVRAASCPTTNVCFATGSQATGSYEPYVFPDYLGLDYRPYAPTTTIAKSTDGGLTWTDTNADLYAVACRTTTNCIEVGDGGTIRASSDGGQTWTPVPSGTRRTLLTIACPSALTCFVGGGQGTVLKTTNGGGTWHAMPSGVDDDVYGLSCPDTSTCYTQEYSGVIDKTTNGGSSWTQLTNSDIFADDFGTGIDCPDDNTCYALGVGLNEPSVDVTTNGGGSWTREELPSTGDIPAYNGIDCTSDTNCTAVGVDGDIVSTVDGINWTKATSNTSEDLIGISCVDAGDCQAVGGSGMVDQLGQGSWTATDQSTDSNLLNGVSCVDRSDCVAVGQGSTTMTTTNGSTWTKVLGGGPYDRQLSMACPTQNECISVGLNGDYAVTTDGGTTWTAGHDSDVPGDFDAVSCASASTCVAVASNTSEAGDPQVFVSTNVGAIGGPTWTERGLGGGLVDLTGVSCQAGSMITCFASESNGRIAVGKDVTGSNTWSTLQTGVSGALNAIYCLSSTTCLAVGQAGTIISTNSTGAHWTIRTDPFSSGNLNAVGCSSDGTTCFGAGDLGTLVWSDDGGNTWAQSGTPLSGSPGAFNDGGGQNQLLTVACDVNCIFGGNQGALLTPSGGTISLARTDCSGTSCGKSVYGNTMTLSATIATDSGGTVPSGDAQLWNGPPAASGSVLLDTEPVDDNGIATFTTSPLLPVGLVHFYVRYLGDDSYSEADSTVAIPVQVTPKPLSVQAPSLSITYGDPLPSLTPSYIGLVSGDTYSPPPACTTKAKPTSKAGTFKTDCSSGSDPNYTISSKTGYLPGTLTINAGDVAVAYTGPSTIGRGPAATFTAIIQRTEGNLPLANQKVKFYLTSGTVTQSCMALSDNTGTATCTIAKIKAPSGSATIQAYYAGVRKGYNGPVSDTESITIN
jgi:photosystem II stability/assembly factor-like uncharacterized protein